MHFTLLLFSSRILDKQGILLILKHPKPKINAIRKIQRPIAFNNIVF